MNNIRIKIKNFIAESILFGSEENLYDDTSFLDEGIIDSTGIMELVAFLEKEFAIIIDDEDLVPDNFDSIGLVSAYVENKLKSQSCVTAG